MDKYILDAEGVIRFWAKVDQSGGPEACWPWTKCKHRQGYGLFRIQVDGRGRTVKAHRVAYFLAWGELREDAVVRHSCDNPACCNPAHLVAGTQLENIQDMLDRDRQARGIQMALAKIGELHSNNTSGFVGVSAAKTRWKATIRVDGGNKHLGVFDTPEAASQVYQAALQQRRQELSIAA